MPARHTRELKPGFFVNEELGVLPPLTRLFFQGLWCWSDRNGRIEDRPRRLKAEILPYDEADGESMVASLASAGFLLRYEVDGVRYLQVVNFDKHQRPHPREEKGRIPGPTQGDPKADLGQSKDSPRTYKSALSLLGPSEPSEPSGSTSSSAPPAPAAKATPESAAPKKPTDPRFAPLRAAWEIEFTAATATAYRWQGPKDAAAVHRLIAVPVEEFRAKARIGLRAIGYSRTGSVAQLAAKWNDLALATGPPQVRKGMATPSEDWTSEEAKRL